MSNNTQKLTLNEVVQIIESLTGLQARPSGSRFILRCPAHDDNNPSLSASQSIDKTILLKCFAGCTFQDICESANIKPSSLFPEDRA